MAKALERSVKGVHILVAGSLAAAVVLALGFTKGLSSQDRVRCEVERVIDGDTFVCKGGERVRLILVDAPELDVEPLGPLARDFLTDLMPAGTDASLELDAGERDRYGRLLAYVYLPDGRLVNEVLAREGFVQTMVVPPNVRYVERIRAAVAAARADNAGLWGLPAFRDPIPDEPTAGRGPSAADRGCDPSYPTVCVPSPPPDLQCSDIPFERFSVVGADPHHFDGDGDGVGCEGPRP